MPRRHRHSTGGEEAVTDDAGGAASGGAAASRSARRARQRARRREREAAAAAAIEHHVEAVLAPVLAASAAPGRDEGRDDCPVCLDNPPDWFPDHRPDEVAQHRVCASCMDQLLAEDQPRCPVCRRGIEQVAKVAAAEAAMSVASFRAQRAWQRGVAPYIRSQLSRVRQAGGLPLALAFCYCLAALLVVLFTGSWSEAGLLGIPIGGFFFMTGHGERIHRALEHAEDEEGRPLWWM